MGPISKSLRLQSEVTMTRAPHEHLWLLRSPDHCNRMNNCHILQKSGRFLHAMPSTHQTELHKELPKAQL